MMRRVSEMKNDENTYIEAETSRCVLVYVWKVVEI